MKGVVAVMKAGPRVKYPIGRRILVPSQEISSRIVEEIIGQFDSHLPSLATHRSSSSVKAFAHLCSNRCCVAAIPSLSTHDRQASNSLV